MDKFAILVVSLYQIFYIWLLQSDMLPIDLLQALKDYPMPVLFLISLYYMMKWVERLLEAQRKNTQGVVSAMEIKLEKMATEITELRVSNGKLLDELRQDRRGGGL